jgi:integrase
MHGFPSRRGVYYLEKRPPAEGGLYIWIRHRLEDEPRKRKFGRALAPYFRRLKLRFPGQVNDKNCMRVVEKIRAELDGRAAESYAVKPADATPLSTLIEAYVKTLEARGRTEYYIHETQRRLYATLGHSDRPRTTTRLAWRVLDQLSRRGLNDYLRRRHADGASAEETNHDLRAWRAFGFWLVEEEYLAANPFARMREARSAEGPPKVLSADQVRAFLEACRRPEGRGPKRKADGTLGDEQVWRQAAPPWLYPAVLILSSTGMRPVELARLTWDQVDLRRRLATVVRKGGKNWVVNLPRPLVKWLETVDEEDRQGPLVPGFPYRSPGNSPGSYARAVRIAAQLAGLPGVTLYWLRHSVATELARSGMQPAQMAKAMGWRTGSKMADRYIHLTERDVAGATDKLPWLNANDGHS